MSTISRWQEQMGLWARGILTQYGWPLPAQTSWEAVIRKLASLEEELWALRGRISESLSQGVSPLEIDVFNASCESLYQTSIFVMKGLVQAGVPKDSLPPVNRIPALARALVSSSNLGALPYEPRMRVRYPDFASGFGAAPVLALAWFGGAVLVAATGGLIAWGLLAAMAPDEAAAAVEATRAQVSVANDIRDSQTEWDNLCREVLAQGGSCVEQLGQRPVLPVSNLADIGEPAPMFPSIVEGGKVVLGLALLGILGYGAYKLSKYV